MTAADRQAAAARQRRHTIALWRWALTEPAMDPALTSRQRGAVVRDLASREHQDPDGRIFQIGNLTSTGSKQTRYSKFENQPIYCKS